MASKYYGLVPGRAVVLDGAERRIAEAAGVRSLGGGSGAWARLDGEPPAFIRAIVDSDLFEADAYEIVTVQGAVTDPPSLDAFRRAGSPIGGLLHDPKTDQRWQVDARTVARDTLAFAPARGMSPRLVAGLVCLAVVVAVMVGVL